MANSWRSKDVLSLLFLVVLFSSFFLLHGDQSQFLHNKDSEEGSSKVMKLPSCSSGHFRVLRGVGGGGHSHASHAGRGARLIPLHGHAGGGSKGRRKHNAAARSTCHWSLATMLIAITLGIVIPT